jgi:glycosyltransferase involved in cell wall biosynthesis
VIDVLRHVDILHKIIVINDGSIDSSVEEILFAGQFEPRLRLVSNPENQGKGQASFWGWQAIDSRYLLLLDGDLIGLNMQYIKDLIDLVLDRHMDMVFSQFKKKNWISDIPHWLTPWLSDQRSLRADLLKQVSPRAAAGFGFETAQTKVAIKNEWRSIRVILPRVWHLAGEVRRGFRKGLKNRARMYRQVSSAWYTAGGLHHIDLSFRVS